MRARLKRPAWGDILGPLMPLFATLLLLLVGTVMLGVNPLETYAALVAGTLGRTNALAGLGVPAFAARGDLFSDAVEYGVSDIPTSVVSCLGDSITNGYP